MAGWPFGRANMWQANARSLSRSAPLQLEASTAFAAAFHGMDRPSNDWCTKLFRLSGHYPYQNHGNSSPS
eukprot:2304246-Amphidinium_carterae.1